MAPVSLIPMGTFPVDPDDKNFQQSPNIIFSGKVLRADFDAEAAAEDPNYSIVVETFKMNFTLICQYDGEIAKDNIISGIARLYGDIENNPIDAKRGVISAVNS